MINISVIDELIALQKTVPVVIEQCLSEKEKKFFMKAININILELKNLPISVHVKYMISVDRAMQEFPFKKKVWLKKVLNKQIIRYQKRRE